MKDLCIGLAKRVEKVKEDLAPLLRKYKITNAFQLRNSALDKGPEKEEAITLVEHMGALVGTLNTIHHLYMRKLSEVDTDLEKKRIAYYQVIEKVLDKTTKDGKVSWDKLDNQSTMGIAEHAMQCVMGGYLDDAMMGLIYLYYQKHFELTNKGDKMLKDPAAKFKEEENEGKHE